MTMKRKVFIYFIYHVHAVDLSMSNYVKIYGIYDNPDDI